MNSEILNRKIAVSKDGETIVDLTSQSLFYINDDVTIVDQFYVGDDMQMRPDLLSYLGYGNTDYYDYILKFNGISNPFSIDKGDYILIPDLRFMEASLSSPKTEKQSEDIRKQYLTPEKKEDIDPKRLEFDEAVKNLRKNTQNANFSKYPLPPNLAQFGDKEATINSNGKVILGDNITKNK